MRSMWRGTRVMAEILLGGLLLAAGLVMLVTPGPGIVTIVAGLAVLARHFHWAERSKRAALARIRDSRTAIQARRAVRRAGQDTRHPTATSAHRPTEGGRQQRDAA